MQADKGTLFLDEVGDMPLALQAEDPTCIAGAGHRAGGRSPRAQGGCASDRGHQQEPVGSGGQKEFREDLYYRLNVFPIPLPALRERVEDIAPLARHFAQTLSATAGKRITGFSPEALQAMAAYHWPGNIRELQNCVERATIVAASPVIEDIDLPGYLFASKPSELGVTTILSDGPGIPQDLDAALAEVEKAYILAALQESNGVQAAGGGEDRDL